MEPCLALRMASGLRAGGVGAGSYRARADAERIVAFLQRVQPESGLFQARYLPDGSGVPDARGVELDGVGWALWATGQLAAELSGKRPYGVRATTSDAS